MGRFDEATEQLNTAHALDPLSPVIGFGVGWGQYFLGDYDAAIRTYEKTLQHEADFVLSPWFLGPAFVQAGEYDRAFQCLDEALQKRSWYLVFLQVDPAFAPLRGDPRFDRLVAEVGLDDTPPPRNT